MKLLAETTDAVPLIFLITDGAVQDERDICNFVKGSTTSEGSISPRIFTLGIGKDIDVSSLPLVSGLVFS